MKANLRLNKIEQELQSKNPVQGEFVVIWPTDTEEEKEAKLKKRLEELRQKYGESVSESDIICIRIVYDSTAKNGKDELIEQNARTRER